MPITKKNIILISFLLIASVVGGAFLYLLSYTCGGPSAADLSITDTIIKEFDGDLRFEYICTPYIEVYDMTESQLTESELYSIFNSIFFVNNESIRKTEFVYLNIYNKDDAFRFQLYYDPSTKSINKSNQDHY